MNWSAAQTSSPAHIARRCSDALASNSGAGDPVPHRQACCGVSAAMTSQGSVEATSVALVPRVEVDREVAWTPQIALILYNRGSLRSR